MSHKGTRTVVNTKTGKTQDFSVDMSEPEGLREKENSHISGKMTGDLSKVVLKNKEVMREKE